MKKVEELTNILTDQKQKFYKQVNDKRLQIIKFLHHLNVKFSSDLNNHLHHKMNQFSHQEKALKSLDSTHSNLSQKLNEIEKNISQIKKQKFTMRFQKQKVKQYFFNSITFELSQPDAAAAPASPGLSGLMQKLRKNKTEMLHKQVEKIQQSKRMVSSAKLQSAVDREKDQKQRENNIFFLRFKKYQSACSNLAIQIIKQAKASLFNVPIPDLKLAYAFVCQYEKNSHEMLLVKALLKYIGKGTEKDVDGALEIFEKLVEFDINEARYWLGRIYYEQRNDKQMGLKFLFEAHEKGNQQAAQFLQKKLTD